MRDFKLTNQHKVTNYGSKMRGKMRENEGKMRDKSNICDEHFFD